MSPFSLDAPQQSCGVPRASGDEPWATNIAPSDMTVFPARAGMSPEDRFRVLPPLSVPRASGDEPDVLINVGKGNGCSPRERG